MCAFLNVVMCPCFFGISVWIGTPKMKHKLLYTLANLICRLWIIMRVISLHALSNSSFHLHPFSFIHFLTQSLTYILYSAADLSMCSHAH